MGFVSDFIGDITGTNQAAEASQTASATQAAASQAAIDQQNKMFEALQTSLAPYVSAGTTALSSQQDLLGLNGNDAQASAISSIQNGSNYQTLNQAGQNSVLQNAAATGGIRGGNTQSSLANYSTNLLNSLVQQQYSNLSGITSLGQSSAAGVGNAGLSNASSVSNLLTQQGAATAGGQLAAGQTGITNFNNLAKIGSTIASFF